MVTEYQHFMNGSLFCLSNTNSNGKRRLFISTKNLDISFKIFVSVNRRFILVKRLVLASGLWRSFRSWYRDMFREHGLHLRLLGWRMVTLSWSPELSLVLSTGASGTDTVSDIASFSISMASCFDIKTVRASPYLGYVLWLGLCQM